MSFFDTYETTPQANAIAKYSNLLDTKATMIAKMVITPKIIKAIQFNVFMA